MKTYINEYSTLDALTGCSTQYLPRQRSWNRCGHALCWQCARQRTARLSADLRIRSSSYPALYSMRLSLQSDPGSPLGGAWDALDATRARLTAGTWLTERVSAYRWYVEITQGPAGWNPHLHVIAVSRIEKTTADDEHLRREIADRWATSATSVGTTADPGHQHVERITRTPGRAIRYASKGPLAIHADSRTPGFILLDAALRGDADAAADWAEIETASAHRRWQGTGGSFRRRREQEQVRELDLDELLAAGVLD